MDARYEIWTSGDGGETEIRDPRVTGGINKDVLLEMCVNAGVKQSGKIAYSIEISVNHVT